MAMTDDEIPDRPVGQSFRGGALAGADFSGKDVRGADFTGANLRSAIFRDAKFGVAPKVGAVIFGVALLLAVGLGVVIGLMVDEIRTQLNGEEWDEVAAGGSMLFTLLAFIALLVWRGFDMAIKVIVVLYLVLMAGNVIANSIWEDLEWYRALRFTAVLAVLFLAILAGVLARVVGGVFGIWSVVIVAVVGGLATGKAQGGIAGVVVALSLAAISKRAVRGDRRDRSLRRLAHRLVGRWGTRFVDADLTGVDFTGTDTGRCGAKGATLDGVTWDPKQPLPFDLPDDAILADR
jgi:hypothetical protein